MYLGSPQGALAEAEREEGHDEEKQEKCGQQAHIAQVVAHRLREGARNERVARGKRARACVNGSTAGRLETRQREIALTVLRAVKAEPQELVGDEQVGHIFVR